MDDMVFMRLVSDLDVDYSCVLSYIVEGFIEENNTFNTKIIYDSDSEPSRNIYNFTSTWLLQDYLDCIDVVELKEYMEISEKWH